MEYDVIETYLFISFGNNHVWIYVCFQEALTRVSSYLKYDFEARNKIEEIFNISGTSSEAYKNVIYPCHTDVISLTFIRKDAHLYL